jgi:hypothetical protein
MVSHPDVRMNVSAMIIGGFYQQKECLFFLCTILNKQDGGSVVFAEDLESGSGIAVVGGLSGQ